MQVMRPPAWRRSRPKLDTVFMMMGELT